MTTHETSDVKGPSVQCRLKKSGERLSVAVATAIVMAFPLYMVISFGIALRNYGLEGTLYGAARAGDVPGVLRVLDQLPRSEQFANRLLIRAAERGQRPVVEALLPRSDRESRSVALRKAVFAGRPDLISPLAAAGADLDTRDERGLTLLMSAATYSSRDCVAALLRAGANPRLKDPNGRTARDLAVSAKEWPTVRMLDAAQQRRPASDDGR